MKRFLLIMLLLMLVCSFSYSQIFRDEPPKKPQETKEPSPFNLFFSAGSLLLSDSGDFIDHINSISDRSSSRFAFSLGLEFAYNISDDISASLLLLYAFPSSNTFSFNSYNDYSATDKYTAFLATAYFNYRFSSGSGNYPYFSAGGVYSRAKYSYTGYFVTKNNDLISGNDDSACMDGFGFSLRAGYYLQIFNLNINYNNVFYTMNEGCFIGYARDYNASILALNIAVKAF